MFWITVFVLYCKELWGHRKTLLSCVLSFIFACVLSFAFSCVLSFAKYHVFCHLLYHVFCQVMWKFVDHNITVSADQQIHVVDGEDKYEIFRPQGKLHLIIIMLQCLTDSYVVTNQTICTVMQHFLKSQLNSVLLYSHAAFP